MLNLLTVETGKQYRDDVSRLISWGHWFMLFNIVLSMLIATRYVMANPWPNTGLGQFYLFVSWIGHFGYIGFVFFLLTIFPLTFLFSNPRILRPLAVLIATTVITLLLVDTQFYQLFKFHITPQFWELIFKKHQANISWTFLFIAVPAILFLEILFSAKAWRIQHKRQQPFIGKGLAFLFVICFLVTHTAHIWADANFYSPITAQKSNFPLSYPMTARTFLAKHGWLDLDAFKQKEKSLSEQNYTHIVYPLSPIRVQPKDEKANILLVVFKGLRSDLINETTTPNLKQFSAEHMNFTHHIAGDNTTENSLFSLFFGLPGQYAKDMLHEKHSPLLIDELQRQDYIISAFGSTHGNTSFLRSGIFSGVRGKKGVIHQAGSDENIIDSWVKWLAKQDVERPWFSLISLDAPGNLSVPENEHGPYQPEMKSFDPFVSMDDQKNLLLINRYKNSVYFADQYFGKLMAHLHEVGALDNTIIIVTSDHGFEFNESGRNSWGAGNNYSLPQLAVPMIISWPKMPSKQFSQMTTHLDLAPTLLQQALGVQTKIDAYSTGQSLFDINARNWILVGSNTQYVIFSESEITLFDRNGTFLVYDNKNYHEIIDGKANLPMLLQVISDMNRFRSDDEPDIPASNE